MKSKKTRQSSPPVRQSTLLNKKIYALRQQLKAVQQQSSVLSDSDQRRVLDGIAELTRALANLGDNPSPTPSVPNSELEPPSQPLQEWNGEAFPLSDSHLITGEHLVINLGNPAASRLFRVSQEELIGTRLTEYVDPRDHANLMTQVTHLAEGAHEQEWEMTVCPRRQTPVTMLFNASALRDLQGQVMAVHWIIRDIRERRRALIADQLVKHIGEYILQGLTAYEILPIICDRLVEMFGYPLAWIGIAEGDSGVTVRACSGSQAHFLEILQARWEQNDQACHPIPIVLETRKSQFLKKDEDPLCQPWFEWAKRYGIESGLIVPLLSREKVLGVLGIYASHQDAFDLKICQWFEHLASQITLSLIMAKKQENLRLRGAAIDSAEHAVFITDREGRIEWVNDAYTRLTGFTPGEIIGQKASFIKQGKMRSLLKSTRQVAVRSHHWRNEIDERRKDGNTVTIEQVVTPLRNDEGEITNFVAVHQDITVRKEAEARIFHLAHHDPLTDLPNRVMFHDRLKQALAQARRHGRSLAVVFLDLDHFKPINDSLGHDIGDELLKHVASLLTFCVRATDTVSRLSGDEFTLILQDLDRGQDAGHVAQKILEAIAQPISLGSEVVHTTASLGIALYPFDATTPESLIVYADRAMYRAKEKGGNCYQFVSEEMNAQAFERLMLEKSLRNAWKRGEFLLHYQPEVDVQTGRMTGIEALLRWQHPELGLIFPNQFISIAQEIQLIETIHTWVFRMACQQSKRWQQAHLPYGPIGVNLFLGEWQTDHLVDVICRVLEETQMCPVDIRTEIPQSSFLNRQKDSIALGKKLHRLGISIVIDDFCPIPSMNQILDRLPIHGLKLAQSIILNLPQELEAIQHVQKSVALAEKYKLRVMAKGVESVEQVSCLRQFGCQEIQGYLYHRPLPADEMTVLLRGWWASEF